MYQRKIVIVTQWEKNHGWPRRHDPIGIGKPLMIALGALLASGVLFRGGGTGPSTSTGAQPTSNEGTGGLLGGLGGLLDKLQRGQRTNSWVGSDIRLWKLDRGLR